MRTLWLVVFISAILVVIVDSFIEGVNPTQASTTTYHGEITEPGRQGAFSSPGYPGLYPDNYEYMYQIGTDKLNQPVTLSFKFFDLEYCDDCSCDSLTVRPVNPHETPQTFCGSGLPNTNGFVHTLSSVIVTFKSNGAKHGNGFYATYAVSDPITQTPPYPGPWTSTSCPPQDCPTCKSGSYLKWNFSSACPVCECHSTSETTRSTPYDSSTYANYQDMTTPPYRDYTNWNPYSTTQNYQWQTTQNYQTGTLPFRDYTTGYPYWTTENYYPWITPYYPYTKTPSWNPYASTTRLPYISTTRNPYASTAWNPYTSSTRNPYASTARNPYVSTAWNPYASTTINPYASTAWNPYASTTRNPYVSTAWNPYASTTRNPYASTAWNPYASTTRNPYVSTAWHPYVSTNWNPYPSTKWHPYVSTTRIPYASTTRHPYTTMTSFPYKSTPWHPYPSTTWHPYPASTTPSNRRHDLLNRLFRIQKDAIAVEDLTHTLEADINAAILELEGDFVVSDAATGDEDPVTRTTLADSRIMSALKYT